MSDLWCPLQITPKNVIVKKDLENWVVMCGTTQSYNRAYVNGTRVFCSGAWGPKMCPSTGHPGNYCNQRDNCKKQDLEVNYKHASSDWAVAEVLTWDRALYSTEMEQAPLSPSPVPTYPLLHHHLDRSHAIC